MKAQSVPTYMHIKTCIKREASHIILRKRETGVRVRNDDGGGGSGGRRCICCLCCLETLIHKIINACAPSTAYGMPACTYLPKNSPRLYMVH